MKKLFILIPIFALLLTGCGFRIASQAAGETFPTLPELERVETATYSVGRITTEYADGSSEKQVYDQDYNSAYTSCTFYKNGTVVGTETYTTDEHRNILTATPDWEGGKPRSYSYTYDEAGNLLTEEAFLDGKPDYTTEYSYSPEGILTKKAVTPASGLRCEYLFDSQGRETERLDFDGDILTARTITEYGNHGKRAKVTVYDGFGNVTCWEDYSFNSKSSKETVLEYSGEGELLRKLVNTYDIYDMLMMQEVYTFQWPSTSYPSTHQPPSTQDIHTPEEVLFSTTYWYNLKHSFIEYIAVTEPAE